MPSVELQGKHYSLQEKESVLDGLLRHQVPVPHGCKAGACQSCMMQSDAEQIPAAAQSGLKDTQKKLGYFLSCLCVPSQTMVVSFADSTGAKVSSRILDVQPLNESTIRLRLKPTLDYRAGQYINIWIDETTIRSYSIASVAKLDDFIELHIKKIPGGQFSDKLLSDLDAGESITIQGPLGECFYSSQDPMQTILLVGIGTGLAPLYGIIRDALLQQHKGKIELWLGAKQEANFYLLQELAALAQDYSNFTYHAVAQQGGSLPGVIEGDLYQTLKQHHPSTQGYQVYLCGAESFVRKMKKQIFLAGANMKDIHADVFLPCS